MASTRGMTRQQLETCCVHWPGVTRDIKWGDELVFSVAGKMFVLTRNEPGPARQLFVKVAQERFLELTDQPGIVPAPYLARHHWIKIDEPQRFASRELRDFVRESYALVRAKLPKKTQAALGELPE
jgi:predicted DNA-binding protein (MmcQ/YjbR family)